MKIHHTAIWVVDLEAERDFFLKYFNCTASKIYLNPSKRFSSCFISFSDGGRIEIMTKEDVACRFNSESLGYAHIALDAGSRNEVDNLTARMRNEGVEIISGPRITGDGYYESVILDPESNRIEIISE